MNVHAHTKKTQTTKRTNEKKQLIEALSAMKKAWIPSLFKKKNKTIKTTRKMKSWA